ncbi:phosphatase PAP2 family protein [Actinomadura mexicana]|uniref:Phosphatidic acid phosphatase type 2/haloperoxidase domain-containing protein n=1 Tax=Actinomadura mexicana TaxID=134959 RepID=A0A238Z168_9ACTN|nr:phosphatase PAP2 family protein [Actinomadura mexicana]SNR77097.1 hypothetical protein SAMN06265355_106400 [Actinomadura mexicana]
MRWGSKGWYAVLMAAMVLVTADVLLNGPLRHLDHVVHDWSDAQVQGRRLTAVDVFTTLGQRGHLARVIVPLSVIAALRARSMRYPLASVLIVGVLSLLQVLLKAAIPRTFPISDTDVLFVRSDAYPSGHTLNGIVLVWIILELVAVAFPASSGALPPRRRRDIATVTGTVTAVALTVVDKHWLTDCLFSLALGPVLLQGLLILEPFAIRRGRERSDKGSAGRTRRAWRGPAW